MDAADQLSMNYNRPKEKFKLRYNVRKMSKHDKSESRTPAVIVELL